MPAPGNSARQAADLRVDPGADRRQVLVDRRAGGADRAPVARPAGGSDEVPPTADHADLRTARVAVAGARVAVGVVRADLERPVDADTAAVRDDRRVELVGDGGHATAAPGRAGLTPADDAGGG